MHYGGQFTISDRQTKRRCLIVLVKTQTRLCAHTRERLVINKKTQRRFEHIVWAKDIHMHTNC